MDPLLLRPPRALLKGGAASRRAGVQTALGGSIGLTSRVSTAGRDRNQRTATNSRIAGGTGEPVRQVRRPEVGHGRGRGHGHDRRFKHEGPRGNGARKNGGRTRDRVYAALLGGMEAATKNWGCALFGNAGGGSTSAAETGIHIMVSNPVTFR